MSKLPNKFAKLSFRKKVQLAAVEYWQEFEFLHDWPREVCKVAKEVADLYDEDPNISFNDAYDQVMEY